MKKADKLSGGLQALIGGRDQNQQNEAPTMEQTEQNQTATPTDGEEVIEEGTPEEEQDLINSIEDEELRAALERKRNDKRGRPRKDAAARAKQEEVYTRFCTLVRRDQIAKLKEICFRETLTLKEVLGVIFEDAIEAYESKHGEVKPTTHQGDATTLFKK